MLYPDSRQCHSYLIKQSPILRRVCGCQVVSSIIHSEVIKGFFRDAPSQDRTQMSRSPEGAGGFFAPR
jgi:hypothetical protein